MSKDYQQMYDRFMDYQAHVHRKNQKKIKVGLKVNIFLPLVFLFLSFIIPNTRFLFLMMWIMSLFGIAFYLIYIEYTDYKMQAVMKDIGATHEVEDTNLMGDTVEQVEKAIDDRVDAIEDRIDSEKARLEKEIERLNKEREAVEQQRKEKMSEIGDKIRRKK